MQADKARQHPRSAYTGAASVVLSCASAGTAEIFTYPIDAIKTQLQLSFTSRCPATSGTGMQSAGVLQTARQLVQSHGLAGLYAGLSPAVLRHFLYTGTRISLYEQLKLTIMPFKGPSEGTSEAAASTSSSSGSSTLLPKLIFGLISGGVGQLVAVPADLIKVQMQADVRAVISGQQQRRQFTSISSVATALLAQHGRVTALWQGGLPAVQRAALVNLGELSTYDSAKEGITQAGLLPPGLPTHLAASICSGLVSALISTPADVIKTRLMAQAVGPQLRATSQQPPAAPASAGNTSLENKEQGAGSAQAQPPRSTEPPQTSRVSSLTHERRPGVARHNSTSVRNTSCSNGVSDGSTRSMTSSSSRLSSKLVDSPSVSRGLPCDIAHISGLRLQQRSNGLSVQLHRKLCCRPAQQGTAATMPRYHGMLDCAVQIMRQEGLAALYKGFWPTWARLGPWQLVFWVTYEQLRAASDMQAF